MPNAIQGPGKVAVSVSVNGVMQQASVEPCVTLLEALRDFWGLTGAKRGCDRAACGACTVLVNGKREYACGLLAIDVQDDEITTVESLAANGTLDKIQQAFIDNDAFQCGFCTSGFIMSCKAFLAETPGATRDEILRGLGGNLCRCGSYVGICNAVLQVVGGLASPAPAAPRA